MVCHRFGPNDGLTRLGLAACGQQSPRQQIGIEDSLPRLGTYNTFDGKLQKHHALKVAKVHDQKHRRWKLRQEGAITMHPKDNCDRTTEPRASAGYRHPLHRPTASHSASSPSRGRRRRCLFPSEDVGHSLVFLPIRHGRGLRSIARPQVDACYVLPDLEDESGRLNVVVNGYSDMPVLVVALA